MPQKNRQQQNAKKDAKAKKSEAANGLNDEMNAEAKKKEVDRQEASSYYSCIRRKSSRILFFLFVLVIRKHMQKEKVKVKRLVALFYFYRKIAF